MMSVIENQHILGSVVSGGNGFGKRVLVRLAASLVPNTQAIDFKYPKQSFGNTSNDKK